MAELQADFELLPRETLEAEMELLPREEIEATFEMHINADGRDAKINGVNTLTLTAEDGIVLTQVEDVATLSAPSLVQGIENEKTARENADTALGNRIDTVEDNLAQEITDRGNADEELQDNIDAEEQARKDADEDLQDAIDTKQPIINDLDTIRSNAQAGKQASDTISTYGDIVTHDVDEFATAAQGALADTALQSGDNISELNNNVGYITGIDSADVVSALGYTPYDSANPSGFISGIDSLMVTTALGYTPYDAANPSNYQTGTQVANAVGVETTNRENADIALQQQIDAITASSDVKDIVGTYAELEDYDTSTLGNNDIIKVLQDETQNGATTYYRWNTTTQTFSLIGQEGPYYTKSEADSEFVPQTRTVNGKALSSDITLSPSDIGAQPSGNYVTTDTAQDITATKTFKAPQKFQSGDAAGCLTIGADASATTVSSNTRKLGLMCFYTNEDPSLKCSFVSTDSQDIGGDVINFVEFGGRSGDQLNTSPDTIKFTVANSHNSTTSKTTIAEYTASGSQFNNNNLAVITANRTSNSGGSFIKYARKGTSLGHLGIAGTGVPTFSDASATNNNVLVRCGATTAPAVGSATKPVYIDSNGIAQECSNSIPTDNSQLTNGAGYITGIDSLMVTTALGYTPYDASNPNGYISGITSGDVTTALGYTPYDATNPNGYISGITSGDVTTALGYTPYDVSNPSGYISGISSSDVTTALGYTPANVTALSDYVTIAGTETITGDKTFTEPVTIQNGQGTGCLLVGANVNSSTLSNNQRKLARINAPSYANKDLGATLIGWDTSGDSDSPVTNKSYDSVCFGGMKKITNCTSPMSITFCVTDTRAATAAANKKYALAMDANEAIFGVQPKYNGNNIATVNQIPTTASDVGALPDSTDYAADLSYSSNTLQLLDQDGNALGSPVTITTSSSLATLTDVTLTSPTSGQALLYNGSTWVNGSAGVSATYDSVNERITFA